MIYLKFGLFRSLSILFSVIVLPITIGCIILTVVDFRVELLVVSLLLFFGYFGAIFAAYKLSQSKNYYLTAEKDYLHIKYPNLNGNIGYLEIAINTVEKFEYYKITSVRAWCMLFNSVAPQCTYATYILEGKRNCVLIGYPSIKQLRKLCEETKIKLIVR